jgi:hypothetical protein
LEGGFIIASVLGLGSSYSNGLDNEERSCLLEHNPIRHDILLVFHVCILTWFNTLILDHGLLRSEFCDQQYELLLPFATLPDFTFRPAESMLRS